MTVNSNLEKQTVNYDLGYSDHLAQIMYLKVETSTLRPTAIQKRQFTNTAIEEFIYFLQQETWDEVLSTEDVNLAYSAFMTTYCICTTLTQGFLYKHVVCQATKKLSG